jgi:spore germination cell wall hydrolase CwlJ-like protein
MLAVGWVVLNRLRSEGYPKTVCAVVRQGGENKGCQFLYWCDGESDAPKPGEAWDNAQQVARDLLTNPPPDPTDGALFYHATDVSPAWAKEFQQTARIGKHIYYRKA